MLKDMDFAVRGRVLQVPHFGVGDGLESDMVVTNRSSEYLDFVLWRSKIERQVNAGFVTEIRRLP